MGADCPDVGVLETEAGLSPLEIDFVELSAGLWGLLPGCDLSRIVSHRRYRASPFTMMLTVLVRV